MDVGKFEFGGTFGMGKIITLLFIGGVLTLLGIMNIKGNVSTIHWYNRRKVNKHDIPKYGKCMGAGSIIMGIALIVSAILEFAFKSSLFDYLLLDGCFVGLAVMLYGQFKYNKGIF